ncbi:hypothetical protein IA817_12565 [Listeria seeligeri]|uniref:hypothetical protein n=1 Tax=Listeria seeligeri TaxID=1640 RepID=UPI001888CFE7|nr:hypothetical protein [Listeria seeligeri]MBF2482141.1 hypothetical protein [Listeria seeligeri]
MNGFIEDTAQDYIQDQFGQKKEEQLTELVSTFTHGFKLGMQLAFDAIVSRKEEGEHEI